MLLQGVPARRYDIRGPIISNERPKQTPVRGLGVIRVPYSNYGSSVQLNLSSWSLSQPSDFQRSNT